MSEKIIKVLESTEKEAMEAGLIEKIERADCPAQITKRSTIQYGLNDFFFKEDPTLGSTEIKFLKEGNLDTMDLIKALISLDPTCDLTAQVVGSIRLENGTIYLEAEPETEEEQPDVEFLQWENKKKDPPMDPNFVRYIGDYYRHFIDMNTIKHDAAMRYKINEEMFKILLRFERVFNPQKQENLVQVSYIVKQRKFVTKVNWVTICNASHLCPIDDPRIAEELSKKIYEPMAKKAMGK